MTDYIQRIKNPQGRALPVLLTVVLLALYMAAGIFRFTWTWAVQTGIVAVMSGLLYYIYRYHMTEHEYEISGADFYIRRRTGKRTSLVIDADCDYAVAMYRKEDKRYEKKNGTPVQNCCAALKGRNKTGWIIEFDSGDGQACRIIFEPDKMMLDALSQRLGSRLVL